MPAAIRKTVDRMLDEGRPYRVIFEVLVAFGQELSPASVARYARNREARSLRLRSLVQTLRETSPKQALPQRRHSKILDLPPSVRSHVDQMLLQGITYREVHAWVNANAPDPSWSISEAGVARYARLVRTNEDLAELIRMDAEG